MRVTYKFTIVLTCAILAVLAVKSIFRVTGEVELFESEISKDNALLGRALAGTASRIWGRVGESEALDLIEAADARHAGVNIRWVWLDAPPQHEHAPGDRAPTAALEQLSLHESASARGQTEQGEEAMYTYVRVSASEPRRIAVELRESLAGEHTYVRHTVVQEALATGLIVVICGVLAQILGGRFVGRPVRRLVEHARRIGDGDLSSKLDLHSRDELGELSKAMNTMSDLLLEDRRQIEAETAAKLAAIDQIRHADRLATVGRLSAGIAHEVGTPLNVITGHAQLITDQHEPGSPAHDSAVVIDEQAHRVAATIRQLLDFARPTPPQKVAQDLAAVANQVVSLLQSLAKKRDVTIEFDATSPSVRSRVDTGQLQQVIANLVVNAIHATARGGTITVGAARRQATPPADHAGQTGEYACVFVRDRGTGIAPEHISRIFEPFFTTKDIGDGTGLGLSVAYGIIKEHGGWIDVESEAGAGTCFSVHLPPEVA